MQCIGERPFSFNWTLRLGGLLDHSWEPKVWLVKGGFKGRGVENWLGKALKN